MADNKFDGSAAAGNPIANSVPNPNDVGGAAGGGETPKVEAAPNSEPGKTPENPQTPGTPETDPDKLKNMESLVGRQGTELSEFRTRKLSISPIFSAEFIACKPP